MSYACVFPIISAVLICILTLTNADKEVGAQCEVARTGASGICRLISECPEVQDDIRFNGKLPTSCGYQGYKQIVCCRIKAPVIAPTIDYSKLPISVRKCKEYSKYVYSNVTVQSLAFDADIITKKNDRCGHTSIPLIIDGSPAGAKEFPHSAALGYRMFDGGISWDCGGSLVSKRYVLTAAHCINSPKYGVAVSLVRLGELVFNSAFDESDVIDIPIKQIIPFPEYTERQKYNDIALLELKHKVILSQFIRPICLPTENLEPRKLIATGWGVVEYGDLKGNDALLKVVLESYTNEECNEYFENVQDRKLRKGIIETQFCAGSRNDRRDTCQGDSGGPLQIYHPTIYCMYTQVAITSFGTACGITGSKNTPAVYTRVYKFKEWIENIIWANEDD